MRRCFFSRRVLFLLFMSGLLGAIAGAQEQKIHACAGAGLWFEPTKEGLARQVNAFLQQAPSKPLSGRVVMLVSPHAGYAYAGRIMGSAYKTIAGAQYDRVIILAFSHSLPVQGIAVTDYARYETPLGSIPVDADLAGKLGENSAFSALSFSHIREHSDENQLPFLQTVLKNFKMLSLHVSDLTPEEMDKAAAYLKRFVTPSTLIVVSSDFTHYGADYGYVPFRDNIKENLYALDGEAIRLISAKDYHGFETFVRAKQATVCGHNPIRLALRLLDSDTKGQLIAYMTSGELDGNFSRSVGYAAIAFTKPEAGTPAPTAPPAVNKPAANTPAAPQKEKGASKTSSENRSPVGLTLEEKKTLVRMAREALVSLVATQRKPQVALKNYSLTDRLKEKSALYVTLYKDGTVRGRYGFAEPQTPLYEALIDRIEAAAFYDPQFRMVTAEELPHIDIEITVNGAMHRITEAQEMVFGRDGVLIQVGKRAGIIMPPSYLAWAKSAEEMLRAVCESAGLDANAWEQRRAKILAFPSETFRESAILGTPHSQTDRTKTESVL